MAVYADRVKETTTTTGTGTYALGGASQGFRTFAAGVGSSGEVTYCVEDGTNWEVGLGTLASGTIARTTIFASSNGGSVVSWGAGSKAIYLTPTASLTAMLDRAQTWTQTQTFGQANFTSRVVTAAPSFAANFNLTPGGSAPVIPVNGDMWATSAGVFARVNGTTVGPFTATTGTVTSVTLTQPAAGITVSDSGTAIVDSGTRTIGLANDLAALEGLSSTGFAVRTGTDAWAQRTITGTTNQINLANGNGVSGNPTLTLSSTLVLPGTFTSSSGANTFGGSGAFTVSTTGGIALSGSKATFVAPATGAASINLPHGTAPTTPVNGDLWTTTTGLFFRLNGVTVSAAPVASPSFTGTVAADALTTSGAFTANSSASFTSAVVSSTRGFASGEYAGGSGAPGTINWNNGQNQTRTLTSSGSLTFSNPVNGATYKLRIVQGGAGSFTITWPTIRWAGGVAPVLSTAAASEDVITLYYNGTSYYGQAAIGFV